MKRLLFILSLAVAGCATTPPVASTNSAVLTTPETVAVFEDVELVADELAYVEEPEGAPLFSSPQSGSSDFVTVASTGRPLFVLGVHDGWYRVRYSDNQIYYTRPYWLSKLRKKPLYSRNTQPDYTPNYSPSSTSHSIQTGPRGGKYYINKNGNKTYIKR